MVHGRAIALLVLVPMAGACGALLGIHAPEVDAAEGGLSGADGSDSPDVANASADGPNAAPVSPCVSGKFDLCYDFTPADPLSGWTFISPPDSTFDPKHFTRTTTTSVSGPASLRYQNPSTNFLYRDALRATRLEIGTSYYVAFSTKVENFGSGLQFGTMALELSGSGQGGDIYFYQKNGLVFVSTRYFDAGYLSGPRSPDFQVTTQEQWHRYEVWLTTGSPPRLRFAMDGDVKNGVNVEYDAMLPPNFTPDNATVNIGIWDLDTSPNPATERIVDFDDVVFDVTN